MKTVLALLVMLIYLQGDVEAQSLRIGETAPPLRLPNVAGKKIDTERLRGKTVVIYFWNNRCGCVEQLGELRSFIHGINERPQAFPFEFLTVNEGQSNEVVKSFLHEHGLAYEVLMDADLKAGKNDFAVKVLPTIIIIDKWGVLREKVIGVVGSKKLQEIISRYL
jgi:peroxiredoxin